MQEAPESIGGEQRTEMTDDEMLLFGTEFVNALYRRVSSCSNDIDANYQEIITVCGGTASWDKFVVGLFAKVAELPSGLCFNAMRLAATAGGEPAVKCVVCNSKPTKLSCAGRGSAGGILSPFHSFETKHLKSPTHEKARDKLIDEVAALANLDGVTREALAVKVLLARQGKGEHPPLARPLCPAGAEPLAVATRSSVWGAEAPGRPPTQQEQLDAALGTGSYCVTADGALASCLRCSAARRRQIDLSHPAWLFNAREHFEAHSKPKRGMHTLEFFGIRSCATPLLDAISPLPMIDYSTLCHGLWLPEVTIGNDVHAPSVLLDEWKPGARWCAEPRFSATLVHSRRSASRAPATGATATAATLRRKRST